MPVLFMKRLLLQKILLPSDERLQIHWGLFYRAPRLSLSADCKHLYIPSGVSVDFATYLNGFSIQKWGLYSDLKNVTLNITAKGHFLLKAVGYHLNPVMPDRVEFSSTEYNFSEDRQIALPFPDDTKEQLFSFEIIPFSDCEISDGAFYADFEDLSVRDVRLCLATTTMKKEEFIKKNVRLLKEELLSETSEIRDNFFVHVVDNGRTLQKEEIEGFHVTLHPNKNVGGSGGFARGMIEAMHQTPEATHVLLMDDDVLVLPESIRRTYTLLTVLKPEWQDAFISGAMLEMEAKFIQHEALAILSDKCLFSSVQPISDQNLLENVIRNNIEISNQSFVYGAWWYCCIPITKIKENGLPLPLFIRGDDAEYGLRAKAKCIAMSGLCIWHMGFANKYNAFMDLYQVFRNLLIVSSTTEELSVLAQAKKLRAMFYKELREYAYNGAELLCLALEHYLKGPAFLEEDKGEAILKEYGRLNEKLIPISSYNLNEPLHLLFTNPGLSLPRRILYRLTINFQRFCPFSFTKKEIANVIFGGKEFSGRQYCCRKILAVNEFNYTGIFREQNRKVFHSLMRRFSNDWKQFNKKYKKLAKEYSAKREWLTSEEFWKGYLGI